MVVLGGRWAEILKLPEPRTIPTLQVLFMHEQLTEVHLCSVDMQKIAVTY